MLFLSCFCACLFIDALWSPAGKGLTSWLLAFVCDVYTEPKFKVATFQFHFF